MARWCCPPKAASSPIRVHGLGCWWWQSRPLELFIDAREAIAAAVSVSDDWTRYFSTNRSDFTRVHVLAGSKVVQLTVAIAQHLSRTGNLIQIYSDPAIFESRLALAGGR